MRIHVCSAHFGGPPPWPHALRSEHHTLSLQYYTDSNSPARSAVMHPRLRGKVPKMLEWRNVDADWYIWLDSSVRVKAPDLAEAVLQTAGDHPLCLFRHSLACSIREEAKGVLRGMSNGVEYFLNRYSGEPIAEQVRHYLDDPAFHDNQLFWMGCFAYHRSAAALMQEWFLHNCLWSVEDQLSFPYVLARSGLSHALFTGTPVNNPLVEWDWRAREASSSPR